MIIGKIINNEKQGYIWDEINPTIKVYFEGKKIFTFEKCKHCGADEINKKMKCNYCGCKIN